MLMHARAGDEPKRPKQSRATASLGRAWSRCSSQAVCGPQVAMPVGNLEVPCRPARKHARARTSQPPVNLLAESVSSRRQVFKMRPGLSDHPAKLQVVHHTGLPVGNAACRACSHSGSVVGRVPLHRDIVQPRHCLCNLKPLLRACTHQASQIAGECSASCSTASGWRC